MRSSPAPAGWADLGRPAVERYRIWLRDRWGVALDFAGAVHEPAFDPREEWRDPFPTLGLREATDRSRGIGSDFVTWFMAKALLRESDALRDREVWEVGCGAGILASLAARLGARRVRAADVSPRAVELARRTAALNGARVDAAVTDLFRGCPWRTRPDVLVADLPQKPVSVRYPLNEDGGPEGTAAVLPFLEEARRRLRPGGTLFFFLHALPHPRAMRRLHELFRPRLVSWMWLVLHPRTIWEIHPYLVERRARDLCWFRDLPGGRIAYPLMIFAAR